jgi:hypothetical protein
VGNVRPLLEVSADEHPHPRYCACRCNRPVSAGPATRKRMGACSDPAAPPGTVRRWPVPANGYRAGLGQVPADVFDGARKSFLRCLTGSTPFTVLSRSIEAIHS